MITTSDNITGERAMTIVKDLKGMVFTGDAMGERDITVRFTSDKHGESISLEFKGIMFLVPFEPVIEIIEQARNRKEEGL